MLTQHPLPRLLSDRDTLGLIVANPRTSQARATWARWMLGAVIAEIERREKVTAPVGHDGSTQGECKDGRKD